MVDRPRDVDAPCVMVSRSLDTIQMKQTCRNRLAFDNVNAAVAYKRRNSSPNAKVKIPHRCSKCGKFHIN